MDFTTNKRAAKPFGFAALFFAEPPDVASKVTDSWSPIIKDSAHGA
jgi:hypothetical protein